MCVYIIFSRKPIDKHLPHTCVQRCYTCVQNVTTFSDVKVLFPFGALHNVFVNYFLGLGRNECKCMWGLVSGLGGVGVSSCNAFWAY